MPSLSLLLAVVDTVSVLFLGDIMQHRQQLELTPSIHPPTTTRPTSVTYSR